jgi:hypothetical protein
MNITAREYPTSVARYPDSIDISPVDGVSVSNSLAFVTFDGSGLRVLDISDPTHPSLSGYYVTDEPCYNVYSVGNDAYVCYPYSFAIIEAEPSIGIKAGHAPAVKEASLTAAPNPARGVVTICYTVPEPQRVSLKLYDVAGKLVRTLASGPARAGVYPVRLDTHIMARGVYVLRCTIGTRTLTRKMAIE